jgi:hypothetical protein
MKNLKVEESVEAYFEANTESYRSQILGIVIPQLNDEERIEFYSRLSNRFKENIKVLQNTNEKREKSLTVAHNAVNIASENVNRLNFHNLRAKLLLTFSALLFCLCISAQNFKEIDFRNQSSKIMPTLCNKFSVGPHNWIDKNGNTTEDHSKGEEVMMFKDSILNL